MNSIFFHADDFAVSPHASDDILSLCADGLLDSISIIPNMPCFESCVEKFKAVSERFPHPVKISVHLNFMEGPCVAPAEELPGLVDEKGLFKLSWISLFLASFSRKNRGPLRKQLSKEISAQINRLIGSGLIDFPLRLDSHQHTHHIPLVCDALHDALVENNYPVEYIRNSREPFSVYLKNPGMLFSFGAVNIIKYFLLNSTASYVERRMADVLAMKSRLCGVLMSGTMDDVRLLRVKDSLLSFVRETSYDLEVLFHPGTVLPAEINEQYNKPGFVNFSLSENRRMENDSVRNTYHFFHGSE